jgi:hypothetical protein
VRSLDRKLTRQNIRSALLLKMLAPDLLGGKAKVNVRIPINIRYNRRFKLNPMGIGNYFIDAFSSWDKSEFDDLGVSELAHSLTQSIKSAMDKAQALDASDRLESPIVHCENQGFSPLEDIICTSTLGVPQYVCGLTSVPLSIMLVDRGLAGQSTNIEINSVKPINEDALFLKAPLTGVAH